MTATQVSESALSDARHAWVIGGALLMGSVVVSAPLSPYFGGGVIKAALFAAALVVFAFGIRGSGSVTARRPLGTTALVVLAELVLFPQTLINLRVAPGFDWQKNAAMVAEKELVEAELGDTGQGRARHVPPDRFACVPGGR